MATTWADDKLEQLEKRNTMFNNPGYQALVEENKKPSIDNGYAINYEDERFKDVDAERDARLQEINDTYNNMVSQSDDFYNRQIDAVKDYANTQQDLQNQQTDLAVNEINQAKEQANKSYLREQRGAYADWQKQSNRYGTTAEQLAQNGLINGGYAESTQVSMYNQYQNRVATARESYNLAIQNYDNKIAEARLANNSKLAEIAFQALQQELELGLNSFQYKNTLLLDQLNKQQAINDTYYNRWQNVLQQINLENSLAEQIRQYNEKMEYQKERDKVADKQWEKEYKLAKKAKTSGGTGKKSSKGGSVNIDLKNNDKNNNEEKSSPKVSSKLADIVKKVIGENTTASAVEKNLKKLYDNGSLTKDQLKEFLDFYGLE